MRTISTAEQQLRDSDGGARVHLRVKVKDAGGTFRDLSTYPGENLVLGATWRESVDDPGLTANVTLQRAVEDLSLSPLHEGTPLNRGWNPSASFAALLQVGRMLTIETALTADEATPATWRESFRGYIDRVDWAGEEMTLECRDQVAVLQDTFIERERVYGIGSATTWQASKAVAKNEAVVPSVANGHWYRVTTAGTNGGTEPTWPTSSGGTVTSGGVTYQEAGLVTAAVADRGAFVFELGRAYALNDIVIPTEGKRNAHWYRVTTAGTSSSSAEPTWPTSSGGTVVSGTVTFTEAGSMSLTQGVTLETVLQQLLNDNITSSPPALNTPTSPGWALLAWLQERVSVWDALRALVDQMGWDLRYRWDNGSSSFKLSLTGPDRAKTTADATVPREQVLDVRRCEQNIEAIRNVVRVVYSDSSDKDTGGNPKRKTVESSDATSISAYGRRFMEVQEDSSSQIDSATEATTMADAIRKDLASPVLDFEPELRFFPWVELGDLLELEANDLHFTANQKLAVIGYEHRVTQSDAVTSIQVRGKPAAARHRWLGKAAEAGPERVHDFALFNAGNAQVAIAQEPVVGGMRLSVDHPEEWKISHGTEYEWHASQTPGFTPSTSTLLDAGRNKHVVLPHLAPGVTFYAKAVPVTFNGRRRVRGLPTEEVTVVAGRAKATHYDPAVSQGHYPWNGTFEHAHRSLDDAPPDHWEVPSPSLWGGSKDVWHGSESAHGRYLVLMGTAVQGTARSACFPVRRTSKRYNLFVLARGSGSSAGGAGKDLEVVVEFFKDSAGATPSSDLASTTHSFTSGPAGSWVEHQALHAELPADANYARVTLRKEAADANLTIDVAAVHLVEAVVQAEVWQALTYSGNWADYGSPFTVGEYRRTPDRRVELRGLCTCSPAPSLPATISTLPAGYRPTKTHNFAAMANDKFARLVVETDGDVILQAADSGTPEAFVSLDGLSFSLD